MSKFIKKIATAFKEGWLAQGELLSKYGYYGATRYSSINYINEETDE